MKRIKSASKEPRNPLSADELTVLEAGMEHMDDDRSQLPPHDSSRHAPFWRFVRNHKLLVTLTVLLALALIVGLIVGGILLVQHLTAPTDTQLQKNKPITLIFGSEDPISLEYDAAVKDGIFYVDMMAIADYMDLKISGTATRLCFEGAESSTLLLEHGKPYAVINGVRVTMMAEPVDKGDPLAASARVSDRSCLVPFSFLRDAVKSGFSLKLNSKTNTLRIRPLLMMVDGNKENAVPTPILFTAEPFEEYIIPEEIDPMPLTPSYPIDITPYENAITAENLLLVNKTNHLKSSYEPDDLVKLTCPTAKNREFSLCRNAAKALSAMFAAMQADGITDVYVTSAFRSYADQEVLYERYVQEHIKKGMTREQAEQKASTYSARPGQSEHQSGLCIDLTSNSVGGKLEQIFEDTPAFEWLSKNAWQYGFILRFPASKQQIEITGYKYEPWHYRFVGRTAAEEIYRMRLTLEEYLEKN